jgi:hypothetical protein
MKSKNLLLTILFSVVFGTTIFAQVGNTNIYFPESVQVVGTFNGYSTTPYGTDYRTTTYRTVSTVSSTAKPTDGRGQWATTINVATSGGDVTPANLAGGGGNGGGFLFISGPSTSRFNNKWAFSGVAQATLNTVNNGVKEGAKDMGIDMSTPGYYTFVMNDAGYVDTKFFIGRTSAAPVTVARTSQTVNGDNSITVSITTSAALSSEAVYVRYVTDAASDFSGTTATSIVAATGSGTSYTATIPAPASSTTIKYYIFTSTATGLATAAESDKSLSVIRYDDNSGANYTTPIVLPINLQFFTGTSNNEAVSLNWKTSVEINANNFNIEKLTNSTWNTIGTVAAQNIGGSNYSFIDNAPDNGSNTYRLKLVDKDGTSNYSAAITINAQVTSGLKLYPTLVNSNSINIVFNEQKAGKATIKVTALNGKVLQQNTVNVNEGNMVLQQTLPLLTKGNYVVTVSTAKTQKTFTIVVQ